MKKLLLIVTFIILFISGCKKDFDEIGNIANETKLTTVVSEGIPENIPNVSKFAPNQIVVKFKNGKKDEAFLRQQNSVQKEFIQTATMKSENYDGIHILMVPDVSRAIEAFKRNPNVEWVEPNWTVKHDAYTPNDTYYPGSLWGLSNIKAPVAWNTNIGDQEVYIGVIDEGIMYFHEDLCGQIWKNPYENQNGIDDDGNGYIDDIHGWDFMHMDNTIFDLADNHGTHVAGTIGAVGNNGKGVVGVSPNVTLISGKFLEGSGYISDAIKAVDYFTDLKTRYGMNIAATSNSWGGGGYSQGLYDAINRAKAKDILFIAAAGNDGINTDVTLNYPSCYNLDNIISVAAYNNSETLPSWTNYGATTVDLGAPGVSITSTLPGSSGSSSYGSYSGTSMATPHVAGAAALYKAGNPTATYTQVKTAILSSVRPISALAGKSVTGGALNIETFVKATTNIPVTRTCVVPPIDATPPSAVPNYRLVSKDTINYTATLAWDAATDNVGVTRYVLEIPYTWYTLQTSMPSTTKSYTAAASPGTVYDTKIWAQDAWNNQGPSSPLKYDFGNDTTPPTTPKNFRVVGINPTSISFGYDWSTDNWSGIGMYRISYRREDWNYWSRWHTNSVNPLTVPSLTTGAKYYFTIAAMDANKNWSPESSPAILEIPREIADVTAPTAPVLSTTSAGGGSIGLSWTASSDNIGVIGYKVYYKPSNSSYWYYYDQTLSSPMTVSGLSTGVSYDFYVVALDNAGNSTSSNIVTRSTVATYTVNIVLSGSIAKKTNQRLSWSTTVSTGGVIAYSELQRMINGTYQTIYTVSGSALSGSYTNVVTTRTTQVYRVKVTLTNGQTKLSNEVSLTSQVR